MQRIGAPFLLFHVGLLFFSLALQAGCASLNAVNPFRRETPAEGNAPAADGDVAIEAKNSFTMELAKGRNLERSGKLEDARQVYEQLLHEFPNRHEPYHRLGIVADQQRRHTEAEQLFVEALRLEPRNAEAFNDLGYCFYLQGQLEKAESALLKATRLAPENSRMRNNLALVIGHQGRFEEALREFEKGGSQADAYYNLAFVHATQDSVEEAMTCFRKALVLDPNHTQAREALASFQQYESSGGGLSADHFDLADGRNLVPYIEDPGAAQASWTDGGADGGVHGAAHVGSAVSSAQAAREATRALHTQARGPLERHMQSNRDQTQLPD